MVYLLFFIAMCAVIFYVMHLAMKADKAASNANYEALKKLPDFDMTHHYGTSTSTFRIAADPKRRKLAVARNGIAHVLGFENILSASISTDGTTYSQVNRGSQVAGAAVGAVLLGPVGLLAGALTGSSRQTRKFRKISLRLVTDAASPGYDLPFYQGPEIAETSAEAKAAMNDVDRWYALLRSFVEVQR